MIPMLVVFAPGARLHREADRPSQLPMHRNGPPGTFVLLDTIRISLPTDQVVWADEAGGAARVGFGGFRFDGIENGTLVFSRVRDLKPEHQLSPDRSWTMRLNASWVSAIDVDGIRVWPASAA